MSTPLTKIKKKCPCRESFSVQPHREKTAKYCSRKCQVKGQWTSERKEKWSNAKKGKNISLRTQFKSGMLAEESPNWRGGISLVKQQAKQRDNYTCQICGLRDEEIMEVDHAIPVSVNLALKNELSNLVTLCPNDHKRKTLREIKAGIYKTKTQII